MITADTSVKSKDIQNTDKQKTIAITRSIDDAAEFLELAHKNKTKAHALPTIQLVSKGQKIVEEFLKAIKTESPDYVVFMSSKAVRLLFDMAHSYDKQRKADTHNYDNDDQNTVELNDNDNYSNSDSDNSNYNSNDNSNINKNSTYDKLKLAIANMIVIAVGPKTRESLECEGIKVNEMPPKTYSSVGIGELFTSLNAVGRKAIIPRSGASTPFLKELLEKIGLEIVEIHLYDVCAYTDLTQWNDFREDFSTDKIDGIVFTSASSVRGFLEIMSKDYSIDDLLAKLSHVMIVAIGPFTADELKKSGITNNIISKVHTVQGAFDTLKKSLCVD